MASNYTTNYQLNQWEAGDQVLRVEFNQDNQKIDTALAGLAAQNAEHATVLAGQAAMLAGKGNCQIQITSYTGDDSASRTLTFDGSPKFVFIMSSNSWMMAIFGAATATGYYSTNGTWIRPVLNWNGSSLTFSNTASHLMCNMGGYTYSVMALIERETEQ